MVVKSRKNSDGANCPKTSRSFKKISNVPNLYRREGTGVYYLRVKRADREFRRSLRTTDPALAKRRLREFEGKASTLNGTRIDKKLLFEDLAERWLATIKPEMKSSEGQTRLIEILLAQGKAEEAADVAERLLARNDYLYKKRRFQISPDRISSAPAEDTGSTSRRSRIMVIIIIGYSSCCNLFWGIFKCTSEFPYLQASRSSSP